MDKKATILNLTNLSQQQEDRVASMLEELEGNRQTACAHWGQHFAAQDKPSTEQTIEDTVSQSGAREQHWSRHFIASGGKVGLKPG